MNKSIYKIEKSIYDDAIKYEEAFRKHYQENESVNSIIVYNKRTKEVKAYTREKLFETVKDKSIEESAKLNEEINKAIVNNKILIFASSPDDKHSITFMINKS